MRRSLGGTYEEALGFRFDIQENKGERGRERDPETDQPRNKARERRHGRKIPERLRAQEPRKGVLLHRAEAVLLLRVEHVRHLREHRLLARRARLVRAVERERMDPERGREVDFVALLAGVARGGQVAQVDVFGRLDELLPGDGAVAGDDRRGAGGPPPEECRRAPGEGEGRRAPCGLEVGADSRRRRDGEDARVGRGRAHASRRSRMRLLEVARAGAAPLGV